MPGGLDRRRLLGAAAGCGAAAALGELAFLTGLKPVAAREARLEAEHVRFRPEVEPVVRLIEETSREKLLEAVAAEIRGGLDYQRLLAALMLAGVRNIKPRPVGFKFHAVLVVNSAHLASLASPDSDRWLPLFWALDYFKGSQARDVQEGDWTMAAVREPSLPPATQARKRFVEAMDGWDEEASDLAAAQLARTAGAAEVWGLFWRYGARDFRDIGHKAIYAANAWRTLQVIGWQHAEPIVRSLAFALLQRGRVNPADADEPADRPWRRNLERVKKVRPDWLAGRPDRGATTELLAALRTGSPDDVCERAVTLLNRGVAVQSLWDGVLAGAGELIMRKPGILGIHCVTSANALNYAAQASGNAETRLLMLLQGAAFMAMFREEMDLGHGGGTVESMAPRAVASGGAGAIEEIFATIGQDRAAAAGKTLGYLKAGGSPEALITAGRRLIFLKGRDSHDYKFSSAALEDYYQVGPAFRDAYLATSMFNLRGSDERDTGLAARTRAALKA